MILYINGNYPHHSLHCELVSRLADLGNIITVFVPIKGAELVDKYQCDHPRVKIEYCNCLTTLDKVFFCNKTHKLTKYIEQTVDLSKVDCILAGTLYSDGAVAYLLHKKYSIPFSVAIRQTDVTHHMKWRPYLNGFIKRLLQRSKKIIFISPSYKQYVNKIGDYQDKYIVIPNAVNDFWFINSPKIKTVHDPISIIYVGEITKNKNICSTILAVAELKKQGILLNFHIVGSGEEEENCRTLTKQMGIQKQVFFHGWQDKMEMIKRLYEQTDIFVMLSYRETFGTVYIEAISQGLPIIYTKNQGIDGYFEEGSVGYRCNPTDIDELVEKISQTIKRYPIISKNCFSESKRFTWETVANKYNEVICSTRE